MKKEEKNQAAMEKGWRNGMAPARALTTGVLHPARDGGKDAAVAEHHDEQRQEEEAGEGEHVVERLLPVCPEAAHRRTLHKTAGLQPAHRAEDKRLQGATGPLASFLPPTIVIVIIPPHPRWWVASPLRCPLPVPQGWGSPTWGRASTALSTHAAHSIALFLLSAQPTANGLTMAA